MSFTGLQYFISSYRLEISYVALSVHKLQLLIDTDRLDPSVPIDVTQLNNTGVLRIDTRLEHGGVMLEDQVRWVGHLVA